MNNKGIEDYDCSIGEQFIHLNISSMVTPGERDLIRSVAVLNEMQTTGKISKRTVHPIIRRLTGEIGLAAERFLDRQKELRRSSTTINDHLLYLHRFIQYLNNNEIILLRDINQHQVLSFLATPTNNKIFVVSSLRMFFRYAYEERLMKVDLSYLLANYKWNKREKLPSFYTADEVIRIESTVSLSSQVGKRNYAVLLLATRLGLRASDIANLSFVNIDWVHSRIVLQQYKTGREIELPLLAEIGEAIISYLKFGRPQSNSTKVFLSARAPYRPMTRFAVSSAVRQIIDTSGISIGQRKHGPHSMRHSLASRLLENEVSLPIISEALGHHKTETTMTYLRIDIKALQKCALDVPAVDQLFYSQKGGVFYE